MTEVIKGLDQIKAKLRKLDSSHNVKIHKAATRAGATALKKGSEARIQGNGKGRLGVSQSRTYSIGGLIVFRIGPYKQHWGLAFQEFGAPGHWIETIKKGKRVGAGGPKKALTIGQSKAGPLRPGEASKGGGLFQLVAGKVWHPGVRKNKFLSRALTEDDQKAFEAVGKRYWQRINKLL